MLTHRISHLVTGILLASSLCPVLAQTQAAPASPQSASVADAARKAREQNKAKPQTAKVFTNEDVADLKGVISIVGAPPAEPATNAATAPAAAPAPTGAPAAAATPGAAATPSPEVKDEAYWRGQFAAARKKLADDTKELDILQREYNLKQQQFYMDPNVALREQNSRADLNKTLEQIDAKKLDVERDQQAITALENQLRQAGGNPGWSREPTPGG